MNGVPNTLHDDKKLMMVASSEIDSPKTMRFYDVSEMKATL